MKFETGEAGCRKSTGESVVPWCRTMLSPVWDGVFLDVGQHPRAEVLLRPVVSLLSLFPLL